MAKRRSRKTYQTSRRDHPSIASEAAGLETYLGLNRHLLSTPFPLVLPSTEDFLSAGLDSDRRFFHPDPFNGPRINFSTPARLRVLPRSSSSTWNRSDPFLSHRLGFHTPQRVALCVRRKARREVLHANRQAGRRGLRPPRRNAWSSISCRR